MAEASHPSEIRSFQEADIPDLSFGHRDTKQ